MNNVYTKFSTSHHFNWRRYLKGNASLEQSDSTVRLVTSNATRAEYTDAQLDDAYELVRAQFRWSPPLRLTIRARFSHPADLLRGTAGFGFWNYPLILSRKELPTLPRAIWFFFASPPSNMKLDLEAPGSGWKAATIDTLRPQALSLIPIAPLAALLMNIPPLYRLFWPPVQRAVAVQEKQLDVAMTAWQVYTLDWGTRHAHFYINGRPVLQYAPSPRGPLCFVMWIDNQYAIVTPWGQVGWGLMDIPGRQWLEINWLAIEQRDEQ